MQPSAPPTDHLPKREEWAIINKFKAMEYERLKQLEKMSDYQRKKHFKEELDSQLMKRHGMNDQEKEEDRRYYEYITKKTQEMKTKEQQQRRDKILKRRQVEQENMNHLENLKHSRQRDGDSGYHLDIGVRSQIERKERGEIHKRDMLDTLDKQLQMKEKERAWQKNQQIEMDEANLKYQYQQFDKRRSSSGNHKGQNPLVYDYYQRLDAHKKAREHELESIIVEEAAARKRIEEDRKILEKEHKKHMLAEQMRQTLDQQVQMHHIQTEQSKQSNPEENSYSVIGNMFKERQSPYNKREYSEYLKRQAQQQNQRKKMEKYMSEEEYRINMNQLNRAVGSQNAGHAYLDRSVGAIGDRSFVKMGRSNTTFDAYQLKGGEVQDQDAETVRMRLENLRQRENNRQQHGMQRPY